MAWFDRSPGGKTDPEPEAQKAPVAPRLADAPTPVAAAPEPKPEPESKSAPKVETLPSTAGLVAYLYKGSRVNGQLKFQGPARIDGTVDGEIQCQGVLTIGEGAEVRAKITGQTVVIRGKVDGDVSATERIELAAPARLLGDIAAPRVVIAEGAVFEGDCTMGMAKPKAGVANSTAVSGEKTAAAQAPKL